MLCTECTNGIPIKGEGGRSVQLNDKHQLAFVPRSPTHLRANVSSHDTEAFRVELMVLYRSLSRNCRCCHTTDNKGVLRLSKLGPRSIVVYVVHRLHD